MNWKDCTTYMGPWDVMSSHLIKRDEPPPGLCSFTRIRLGWISEDQVILVRPGEEKRVVLEPLARGGTTVAVKIPLKGNTYLLVENRQPIGYDRVMPDAGILILKVDPDAFEGAGTVRIMDADPDSPHFAHATFRPDKPRRSRFVDKEIQIAIVPLGLHDNNMEVLVTTPEKVP
jgi:hypothetical protein